MQRKTKCAELSLFFSPSCCSPGIFLGKFAAVDLTVSLIACGILTVAAITLRKSTAATVFVGLAFVAAGNAAFQAETLSVRTDRVKVLYDNGTIVSGSPIEV